MPSGVKVEWNKFPKKLNRVDYLLIMLIAALLWFSALIYKDLLFAYIKDDPGYYQEYFVVFYEDEDHGNHKWAILVDDEDGETKMVCYSYFSIFPTAEEALDHCKLQIKKGEDLLSRERLLEQHKEKSLYEFRG